MAKKLPCICSHPKEQHYPSGRCIQLFVNCPCAWQERRVKKPKQIAAKTIAAV